MANNTLLASDNFASGSLAAGWSALAGFSACKVVAGTPNVAEPNSSSTVAAQVWTGQTWPNDQASEATMQLLTSENSSLLVLFVRLQSGAYSGYQANIGNGNVSVYKVVAGSATQIGSTVTGLSQNAGDVWTFAVNGCCLTVYQNSTFVFYGNDATYTSGTPGFGQYSTVSITHTQVASWRGYSAVQQDGIWQKQGIVLPAIASELVQTDQRGTQNLWIIQDTNPQILAGPTVYKMWFGSGQDTGYAESSDGLNWTRYWEIPLSLALASRRVLLR